MAIRRPLCLINGRIRNLPTGDTLPGAVAAADQLKLDRLVPAADSPDCRLRLAGTISAPDQTGVFITWNNEEHDPMNMHDPANPTRVTVPFDGVYLLIAACGFNSGVAGGVRQIRLLRNNVVIPGSIISLTSPDGSSPVPTVNVAAKLVAGDYIETLAYQSSGSTLNIVANLCQFSVNLLRKY